MADSSPRRRAFTLVELLVVIGILVVIAGLSYGAILASGRARGVAAVESFIANLVRQARHTAMTSGAPVEVRIEQDPVSGRWQVRGITQLIVASETFEFTVDENGKTVQRSVDNDDVLPTPGLAGYGWDPTHLFAPDGTDYGSKNKERRRYIIPVDRRRPFIRSADDGFYISCWFRPPPLQNRHHTGERITLPLPTALRDEDPEYRGSRIGYIPLVLVGTADPNRASIGLILELRTIIHQRGPNKSTEGRDHTVRSFSWTPAAWVGDPRNKLVAGQIQRGRANTDIEQIKRNPIKPHDWNQIGLLYDGKDFKIFVNNEEWASSTSEGFPSGRPYLDQSLVDELHSGELFHILYDAPDGSPEPGPGIIDDVRILRLGSDRPMPLPRQVAPALGDGEAYQIIADHKGVTLNKLQAGQAGQRERSSTDTMYFRHTDPTIRTRAEITVQRRGHVSSKLLDSP